MAYHFYLSKMLCPVAPSKLEVKINGQNKTMTLINEGEINILKKAGLTDVSFNLLLPNVKYPFAAYKSGFKDANYFLTELQKLKTNQKPFQFIVTRTFPNGKLLSDTNMKVSIEDYNIIEDAGEGFDVTVSVKLKQYKDFGTKICKVTFAGTKPKASTQSARSTENAPNGGNYTVVSGDCLWNIAKKFYGNGAKYTLIYDANKTIIEETARKHGRKTSQKGHWIYPGTKLVIPSV